MTRWRLWMLFGMVAAFAVTAAGCSGEGTAAEAVSPAVTTTSDDSSAEERRTEESTRTFLDAFERRDLDTVASLVDEQCTLVQPMSFTGSQEPAVVFDGKDQILGYFGQVFNGMGQISFVDRRLTVAAGGHTSFAQARGNFTVADGRPYLNVYLFRFDWRDGLIVSGEEYANPITFAKTFNVPFG